MRPRLSPGPRLATHTPGHLEWRWVPDAPLPGRPCPSGWSHHLADTVHHMQSGVHGPAAFHLALSPDAPRCCSQRLVGNAWWAQFGTLCGHPLPVYFLADEKHSRCLTDKVYLPTIVRGRVLWHLGYTEEASAAAFTQYYQEFQRAASQQEPSYQVKGVLTDG